MLFDDDRELLEKVLVVPVVNEYGSSETGLIAMGNPDGAMILNTATLFIEVVDDQNQPIEDGTVGKILITDLYNKAHPFIRYEIGDLGSIIDKKGPRTLEKLQGRTSDIARLPNGKVIPGLTFYYVTKSVVSESNNVLEFVITQKEALVFEIQYVASTELGIKEEEKVKKAMATYADASIEVIFQKKEELDRSKNGKLKQFSTEILG